MRDTSLRPSLYEMLYGNFTAGLELDQISKQNPLFLSRLFRRVVL